jgi:hypothetical protein
MEIAPAQKQHTTDSTGKIDKRIFLHPADIHEASSSFHPEMALSRNFSVNHAVK